MPSIELRELKTLVKLMVELSGTFLFEMSEHMVVTFLKLVDGIIDSSMLVDESTITRTLQKSDDILNTKVTNPKAKRRKPVTVPKLELALKEFVLIYQDKAILSEAILIKKAKQLADGLGIPDGSLGSSAGWLQNHC
nr:2847_t:CDS:2 [Entrophospora candida]